MGLAVLPHMEEILAARKDIVDYYNQHLDVAYLRKLRIRDESNWNYSYYPVLFPNETALLKTLEKLNESDIFPRRYFYPSLNTIEYTKGNKMALSEDLSGRVLCLPLYHGLKESALSNVVNIISSCS
jgi:dTDP-4-amino-4,6-dideoxygalactose transaminase